MPCRWIGSSQRRRPKLRWHLLSTVRHRDSHHNATLTPPASGLNGQPISTTTDLGIPPQGLHGLAVRSAHAAQSSPACGHHPPIRRVIVICIDYNCRSSSNVQWRVPTLMDGNTAGWSACNKLWIRKVALPTRLHKVAELVFVSSFPVHMGTKNITMNSGSAVYRRIVAWACRPVLTVSRPASSLPSAITSPPESEGRRTARHASCSR